MYNLHPQVRVTISRNYIFKLCPVSFYFSSLLLSSFLLIIPWKTHHPLFFIYINMSDTVQPPAPILPDNRESQLTAREAAVAQREAAAEAREAAHAEREASLKAREDALNSTISPAVPDAPVAEDSSAALDSVAENTEVASESIPVEESNVEESAPIKISEAAPISDTLPVEESAPIETSEERVAASSEDLSEAKTEPPKVQESTPEAIELSPSKGVKFQEPESTQIEEKKHLDNRSEELAAPTESASESVREPVSQVAELEESKVEKQAVESAPGPVVDEPKAEELKVRIFTHLHESPLFPRQLLLTQ
jgi:hypothetical protein